MKPEFIGLPIVFTGSLALFSKICVFNNLLGVSEMIFYLPQYLSEYLLNPYKLSQDVVTFDSTRKMGQTLLSPGRWTFFLKNLNLDFLGPKEMII